MLTNEARREILNRVKTSGFPGGISEAFKAAEQGVDVISQFEEQQSQQQEMQVAQTQQQQETGLRGEHAQGNTQASMAFPDVKPNQSFNTVGMKAPIDIQKVNDQGHLVESYKNVPPGIQDLPTGPHEGTVIESPAAYQKGGLRMIDPNAEEGMGAKVGEKHQYEIEYKTNDDFENVLSFAPGTGEVIDAKNTVVDVINKDYTGAALNAAGFIIPIIPGGILKKGYKFLKNKVKVPHKPGPSSKINFLDNVKDRVKKDSESGLNYYGRKEFPTNPDLTLTQKNLASHLDKTGKGGTTSLYRYGDEVLDNRGKSSWYSADPIDPFRYESMRGSGKKVFKIDAENAFLSDMYRGGPQQGTGFNSLTEFKEFEVPDWMTGKFGNQQTFDSMTDYKKHLNKLKQTGGFNSAYQKGGLRDHMMDYLHTSGRDTNYVNTVMGSIAQHESKNNATQVQVSGNKTDGYYDGPGRGKYQFEVGADKGGNTAMNRTANFLKHNTNKNIRNFPSLNKLYNADNSLDFTDLNSKDQDALFIGDKIFGGVTRRNSFDAVTRNRTTPPSQEETFKYWLSDHKGKVNGKEISDLTEAEIEVERKKWNSRTKNMFQYGGTRLSTPTNNFTLAKGQRKIQTNERDPGALEDLVTNAGLSFNAATKHSLINTRKLNLQSRLNITPKIGWNSSNKKFSQFGTPSLNLEGSLDLNANYRPTQNTTITAGANFAPNQRPSYTAGINYRFKRGGYVNKYL